MSEQMPHMRVLEDDEDGNEEEEQMQQAGAAAGGEQDLEPFQLRRRWETRYVWIKEKLKYDRKNRQNIVTYYVTICLTCDPVP